MAWSSLTDTSTIAALIGMGSVAITSTFGWLQSRSANKKDIENAKRLSLSTDEQKFRSDLLCEVRALMQDVDKYREDNRLLQETNIKTMAKVDVLTETNKEYMEKIDILSKTNAELTDKIEILTQTNNTLLEKVDTLNKANIELSSKVEILTKTLHDLNKEGCESILTDVVNSLIRSEHIE